MPRPEGTTLTCKKCGATLTYTKGCDCPSGPHSEICCGDQMVPVDA